MSVVLSKRGSSKFEVIDNAMNIRKKLTQYILHDFAITDEMTESEKWFLNSSREVIVNRVRDLIANITMANNIYVTTQMEYEERRKHQDYALGNCFQLIQELQYVIDVFGGRVNVNKYMDTADAVNSEIALIRGWRKSENKLKKKFMPEQHKKCSIK